ncbi:MAG: MATE family efflux transporter [Candidatus Acetothermia bacterium]
MISERERDYTEANITKAVFFLAWPAVVTMMLQMVVGMADIAMAGRLGPTALAAVGLGRQLMFLSYAIVGGLATGATALIAQHYGRGEKSTAYALARQALVGGSLLAVFLGILGVVYAEEFLVLMGAEPEVVEVGGRYIQIVFGGLIAVYNVFLINAAFRGAGDTKTPMFLLGLINIINIGVNYLLIFGVGPFPKLGVPGAAIGTVFSRVLGMAIGWGLFFAGKWRIKFSFSDSFWPHLQQIKRLLQVGVPAAMERLVRSTTQLIFVGIVTHLGTLAVAANQVALRAESFSYMPGFGMAIAATTLVGQNIGAGLPERAEQSGYRAVYISLAFMTGMAVSFFLVPRAFITLFTNDEEVIQLAIPCLRIVAISEPALALNMVLAGAMRGAADTRFPMYITAAGNFLIRLPLAYLLAYPLGLGLVGAWVAMTADTAVRGILMFFRFKSGKWKEAANQVDESRA